MRPENPERMAAGPSEDGDRVMTSVYNGNDSQLVDIKTMHANISDMLREHGAKPTAQRLALARVIFERPQHLSADDLFRAALAAGIRVSKATVYNTLNLFAECGLVREVNVDGSRLYYDSTTNPHHHFFNVDTGELIDIPEHVLRLAEMPDLPPGTESAGVEMVVKVRQRRS